MSIGFDWRQKIERSVPVCRIQDYRIVSEDKRLWDYRCATTSQAKEQRYVMSRCHVVIYIHLYI